MGCTETRSGLCFGGYQRSSETKPGTYGDVLRYLDKLFNRSRDHERRIRTLEDQLTAMGVDREGVPYDQALRES